MIDWMEGFKSYRVHVLIRFGKWHDILQLAFPDDRQFYCVTTTMLHYARALSYSVLDQVENALEERELFREFRKKIYPSRFEYPNSWQVILNVAESFRAIARVHQVLRQPDLCRALGLDATASTRLRRSSAGTRECRRGCEDLRRRSRFLRFSASCSPTPEQRLGSSRLS